MRQGEVRKVRIFDACEVDYGTANVSMEAGDTIQWVSACESGFTIHFESSPFKDVGDYHVRAGGEGVNSGPLKTGTPYASYHYSIQSDSDPSQSADPDVDVRK